MDSVSRTGLTVPRIPVSWGELIDKITILEIKAFRLAGENARENAEQELRLLREAVEAFLTVDGVIDRLTRKLSRVNSRLWAIEDDIRDKEARKEFDEEFIQLARSVYITNDERALIKREINKILGSEIVEEKTHPPYNFP